MERDELIGNFIIGFALLAFALVIGYGMANGEASHPEGDHICSYTEAPAC